MSGDPLQGRVLSRQRKLDLFFMAGRKVVSILKDIFWDSNSVDMKDCQHVWIGKDRILGSSKSSACCEVDGHEQALLMPICESRVASRRVNYAHSYGEGQSCRPV